MERIFYEKRVELANGGSKGGRLKKRPLPDQYPIRVLRCRMVLCLPWANPMQKNRRKTDVGMRRSALMGASDPVRDAQ